MLKLPPIDHPLRDTFETTDLVDYHNLPTFRECLTACRKSAAQPCVKSAFGICLRAGDQVWLIEVGQRGGWKRRWNFGVPYKGCEQFDGVAA